jgi:hypothetical protein
MINSWLNIPHVDSVKTTEKEIETRLSQERKFYNKICLVITQMLLNSELLNKEIHTKI